MLKNLEGDKESNYIKFGCYIYQDSLGYKNIKHIALECEKLGYDSVWLKDNFIPWIQDYASFNSNRNNNSSEPSRQEKDQQQNYQQQEPSKRLMLECCTTLSSLAYFEIICLQTLVRRLIRIGIEAENQRTSLSHVEPLSACAVSTGYFSLIGLFVISRLIDSTFSYILRLPFLFLLFWFASYCLNYPYCFFMLNDIACLY